MAVKAGYIYVLTHPSDKYLIKVGMTTRSPEARDLGKKDAGILRWKPSIHWKKDRGKDVESSPWFTLGLQYGEAKGSHQRSPSPIG